MNVFLIYESEDSYCENCSKNEDMIPNLDQMMSFCENYLKTSEKSQTANQITIKPEDEKGKCLILQDTIEINKNINLDQAKECLSKIYIKNDAKNLSLFHYFLKDQWVVQEDIWSKYTKCELIGKGYVLNLKKFINVLLKLILKNRQNEPALSV
jgi:hypothetical protein